MCVRNTEEKHKDFYVALMDLEKAYDRDDKEALWKESF